MTDNASTTPDVPTTSYAFRVWKIDKKSLTLLSTTPAGTSKKDRGARKQEQAQNPMIAGLDAPLGAWPKGGDVMEAVCNADAADHNDPEWVAAHTHTDGRVASPGPECRGNGGHGCGVYATTQVEIVSRYLGEGVDVVFGLVEMGGETLPCDLGYRAEWVRPAALFLLPDILSRVSDTTVIKLAKEYDVPVLMPNKLEADAYRDEVDEFRANLAREQAIADQADSVSIPDYVPSNWTL